MKLLLGGPAPAAELLHGDEEVVSGDAGYQGIAKRPEIAGTSAEFGWRCGTASAAACRTLQREGCKT